MTRVFYDVSFLAALALMLGYVCMWHKHSDVHVTLVFILVPVINLGYCLLGRTQSAEAALVANELSYIGGCYLMPIMMLSVFSLCHIRLPKWLSVALLAAGTAVFLSTFTIGESGLFYKSIEITHTPDGIVMVKDYGPMHTAFYALIIACFVSSIAAMIYSYIKQKQAPRKLIYMLFLPIALCVASFFVGRKLVRQVELIPAAYAASMAVYLMIGHRICLYDISDTAVDSLVQTGDTGFISLDFHLNYLASNATAKAIFPELNNLTVDWPVAWSALLRDTVLKWLEDFRNDETNCDAFYEQGGRIYQVHVGYLYHGRRKLGYQFILTDDTSDRQYINLLNRFNTELTDEVNEKTAHIVEMHDKLILGMATMVESRDNSTGGHILRTSDCIRIFADELMKHPEIKECTPEFCGNVIKAAPMHDLGKIAVDDSILRKPGRFTDEEYSKMKNHAAKGAVIVAKVLDEIQDSDFKKIAINVAHYHHEKWDGSGYPERLSGTDIPLEARIMALADVFDALVSKRCYKEAKSFDEAFEIIQNDLGKHFDPVIGKIFIQCRPQLEAYYTASVHEL